LSQDVSSTLQIFNESEENISLTHADASVILDLIQKEESATFALVELAYVTEEEIIRVNKEHLDRHYVTDIISFRYDDGEAAEDNTAIEGTLFCCAPRIIEQAGEFDEPVEREFKRIFIHGLLHLIGYEDDTNTKKQTMTDLENKYLSLSEENN